METRRLIWLSDLLPMEKLLIMLQILKRSKLKNSNNKMKLDTTSKLTSLTKKATILMKKATDLT